MPELPEVETTRRGLAPIVSGRTVSGVEIRNGSLRQPVPDDLSSVLQGQRLTAIHRRAKYLLFDFPNGTLLIHLGMSGSLRITANSAPLKKHDHVDIAFGRDRIMRFHDPRRFGLVLWTTGPIAEHRLLRDLGPEPWDEGFTAAYLRRRAAKRAVAVKNFIMDSHTVVGVGNIYASEALFRAGVNPKRAAGRVSLARYATLVRAIQHVLENAIESGGTTLRDFVNSDGEPGYFRLELNVYGRGGEPCRSCNTPIKQVVIGQRSSFYCPRCQR